MAPRNPENIRVNRTVGQYVNRRVRVVYRRRRIDGYHGMIHHSDVSGEGVIRAVPDGYGLTVVTDDGRSIGCFMREYPLVRDESMPIEYSHMEGFDGRANLNYEIEVLSEDIIPVERPDVMVNLAEVPVMYVRSTGFEAIVNPLNRTSMGGNETYRVWIAVNTQWVEVTTQVMMMCYGTENNVRRWYPQGQRRSTFYDHFARNFPGVFLDSM